tara:strand:- start:1719 stop:1949 length:231 start_codon:yes stop_codon:yes gene_type:complete
MKYRTDKVTKRIKPSYLTIENNPKLTNEMYVLVLLLLRNNVIVEIPKNKKIGSVIPNVELTTKCGSKINNETPIIE